MNLAEIKGIEVKLRNNLANKKTTEYREDVVYQYQFTKARRRLTERRAGIRGVALFLLLLLMGCEPMDANVSAYCPCERCCGVYADGITASGHVYPAGG